MIGLQPMSCGVGETLNCSGRLGAGQPGVRCAGTQRLVPRQGRILIHERNRWSPGDPCLDPREQMEVVQNSNESWPGDHWLGPQEFNGSVEGAQWVGPKTQMVGM